ncbi:MAG TPA: hypothetical protein VF803_00640 [Candidatus Paceibacterota bacterium]
MKTLKFAAHAAAALLALSLGGCAGFDAFTKDSISLETVNAMGDKDPGGKIQIVTVTSPTGVMNFADYDTKFCFDCTSGTCTPKKDAAKQCTKKGGSQ